VIENRPKRRVGSKQITHTLKPLSLRKK
jgi:hypothetical protein